MKALIMSDTHGKHHELQVPKKGFSVVIHTGDFSNGSEESTDNFLVWYSEIKCKHKILISGNHDWFSYHSPDKFKLKCSLLGIIYLVDTSVNIGDIKFHGSPWVTKFYDWAFMDYDSDLAKVWDKIPLDTDVLLTHGPAYKKLDLTADFCNAGSTTLLEYIQRIPNIKYHIFGHIHEGHSKELKAEGVRYINACSMNRQYRIAQQPRIINITKGKECKT